MLLITNYSYLYWLYKSKLPTTLLEHNITAGRNKVAECDTSIQLSSLPATLVKHITTSHWLHQVGIGCTRLCTQNRLHVFLGTCCFPGQWTPTSRATAKQNRNAKLIRFISFIISHLHVGKTAVSWKNGRKPPNVEAKNGFKLIQTPVSWCSKRSFFTRSYCWSTTSRVSRSMSCPVASPRNAVACRW